MNRATKSCGQELVSELNTLGESFDMTEFIESHDYDTSLVNEEAEKIFTRLCGRSAWDGVVQETEKQKIRELADSLEITGTRFEELYNTGVEQVFYEKLEEAQADGEITDEELISLELLRESLGLSTVGWFKEDESRAETRLCHACGADMPGSAGTCAECGWKDLDSDWTASERVDSSHRSEPGGKFFQKLGICLGIAVAVVVLFSLLQTRLNGPDFLVYHCGLGMVGVVILILAFKDQSSLRWPLAMICFVVYELTAAIRIQYGLNQGMHRFEKLYGLMILGPVFTIVIVVQVSRAIGALTEKLHIYRRIFDSGMTQEDVVEVVDACQRSLGRPSQESVRSTENPFAQPESIDTPETRKACGRELVSEVNRLGNDFNLTGFIETHDYDTSLVNEEAEKIFIRLCGRSAEDGVVTDREKQNIEKLGELYEITGDRFDQLYRQGVEQVFYDELERAQADGEISDEELIALEQLRESLGLSSIGWFEAETEEETRPCAGCGKELAAAATRCPQCGWVELVPESISSSRKQQRGFRYNFSFSNPIVHFFTISLVVLIVFSFFQASMNGREFLEFYAVTGAGLLAISTIVAVSFPSIRGYCLISGLAVFELAGCIRIVYGGFFKDMHRFDNLYTAMALGPIGVLGMLGFFFGRTRSGSSYSDRSYGFCGSSCSSCGSSCGGGGGGGGGGCGGCS